MEVRVRHFEEGESVHFTDCDYKELERLIEFVHQSGGFYYEGSMHPFNSYQLVLENGAAYAEILVGEEPE